MNKAKAMAAMPEAPRTLGTTMRPAPLLEALTVLLGELLDPAGVVVSFTDVLGLSEPVDNLLAAGTEELPLPEVVVPFISA